MMVVLSYMGEMHRSTTPHRIRCAIRRVSPALMGGALPTPFVPDAKPGIERPELRMTVRESGEEVQNAVESRKTSDRESDHCPGGACGRWSLAETIGVGPAQQCVFDDT
jgi:hypothetical protein